MDSHFGSDTQVVVGVPRETAGTPALYRTRITHLRRSPVHHYFEHHSYCWYVDVDRLPQLPSWLRAIARFDPRDHFDGPDGSSLRERVDAFLAAHGATVPGGRITALMQARVLGYAFNPLSLYWCHDREGTLRHVIAEVHNTRGERHAYLLPPADVPVRAVKQLYASPFRPVDGYYTVRAPRPEESLDITISLHRDGDLPFVASVTGKRRRATIGALLWLQVVAPLAPLLARLDMRAQAVTLWLQRVPRAPWRPAGIEPVAVSRPVLHIAVTRTPDRSVAS